MNLNLLLEGTFRVKASDLHIKVGLPPTVRVNSRLTQVKHPPVTLEEVKQIVREIMPARLEECFEREGAADFSFTLPGFGRFRSAIFRQSGKISISLRRINATPPILEELNLPEPVVRVCDLQRGMVLVTGITGSGKTSTLSAILHRINMTRRVHIVTIEDPIEYVYQDNLALINQMEVGPDVPSFGVAMRRILRFDPDMILIGEMRDRETVETAIEAVDTGHLVFSTLHTSDAKQTVNRILHFFEQREEEMILEMLALNLKVILSQRLLARSDVPGLIPACEMLINTPIVSKLIREGRIEDLQQILKNGDEGMQTFDMCLAKMVREKKIALETAIEESSDEPGLRRLVRGEMSAGDRGGLVGGL